MKTKITLLLMLFGTLGVGKIMAQDSLLNILFTLLRLSV